MKYLKDENGLVYAYEADGSQDEWIKPGLIPMSDDEVQAHIGYKPTIAQLKGEVLQAINAACDNAISVIRANYPDSEALSWPRQEAEAKAYLADENASTTLLSRIAESRGISLSDLVARVVRKAETFAGISGDLFGKRQALEDQLSALPDIDSEENRNAILSITWDEEVGQE